MYTTCGSDFFFAYADFEEALRRINAVVALLGKLYACGFYWSSVYIYKRNWAAG